MGRGISGHKFFAESLHKLNTKALRIFHLALGNAVTQPTTKFTIIFSEEKCEAFIFSLAQGIKY